ncbi:MAG TPA: MMPL family transporter [Gammaproteobacteria bacterium]
MRTRRFRVITLWLLLFAFCSFIVSRVQLGADISAFLPATPTPAQQLLTEQLRDGVVSRLILTGIEGDTPERLAAASKALAQRLRSEPGFSLVNNGEEESLAKDRAFLFENRYLLSSAVTLERFTAEGLHASLDNALQLLGSPFGMMLKRVVPRDPSGELLHLIEGAASQQQPATAHGVWMSADGTRALLILQTTAPGYDIDAQQQLVTTIRSHFTQLTTTTEFAQLRLLLSGPGVFSVQARDNIKGVATQFSIITAILVSLLLLLIYRSWRVLALSLLPVLSGVLAGIAAVSLGYGVVFGITLGFGITLIGEAVDYAIYFFTRLSPGQSPRSSLSVIWPTLRLGVLTTVCGFSPMFLADFPGLAQLGLFSVVGLLVAVLVARWVLPEIVPANFSTTTPVPLASGLLRLIRHAPRLRPLVLLAVLGAALAIVLRSEPIWSDNLASLSPLSEADQRLDESLRRDLGAPDVRYMVILEAADRERALQQAELVGNSLDGLRDSGHLAGYDSPARYLPSEKTQRVRLASLPSEEQARANLQQALNGLPFRTELFEPYFEDLESTRSRAPLTPADLKGTSIGLQIESLLVPRKEGWLAMLPLRGVTDVTAIQQALAHQGASLILLDLKLESDLLYQTYVQEAVVLSVFGALAITLLLFATLRSPRRVARVLMPLAAAIIVAMAIVLANSERLVIFHLVGLLLAMAVGSNYTLFFESQDGAGESIEQGKRTMVSLLVANVSTSIAFGMLAFSGVPVLTAIGETVAIGAFLSLLFAAVAMGDRIALR